MKNEMNTIIGKVLRSIREEQGKTIVDMAIDMNVDKSYISRMETGQRTISAENMMTYIEILHYDSRSLMDRIEAYANAMKEIEDEEGKVHN